MALTGKTCLITGGSRGIGAAIGRKFATEGASLILVARQSTLLRKVAADCERVGAGSAQYFSVDLSKQHEVKAFAAEVALAANVDVLVNSAGVLSRDHCLSGEADAWPDVFSLNVLTPMRLTRAFAEGMKKRQSGAVINLCGVAGVKAFKGMGVYCASKFALKGWTAACAEELRPYGIKVVSLEPSYVDTDLIADLKISKKLKVDADSVAQTALAAMWKTRNAGV